MLPEAPRAHAPSRAPAELSLAICERAKPSRTDRWTARLATFQHQPVRGGLLVRKGRIFNDNVQRRHTSAGAAKGRSVGRRVWSGGSPGCHAVPGQSALADSCMPQQQLSVPLPCVHGLLHTFARLVCIWAALAPQCSFCCLCCTMLCNHRVSAVHTNV